jgi:hypothetical protein
MNPVPISLMRAPGAMLVLNQLLESPSVADLDQDLVLVELPGEVFIDVSWYPENDLSGTYHVTAFRRNDWDHPLDVAEAKTARGAALLVEMMAERYASPISPISCSQESVSDYFHSPATV